MSSNSRNRPNRQTNAAPANGGEAALPPKPPVPPSEPQPTLALERIGDILKRAREKRGDELQPIADYLCIRRIFLEALENNRYDELPADAYVIGFLRSYANYLGHDGADAIDRYRKEMAGRRKKPALVVPMPITEGRTPSTPIMIGAAIVALLIYGLWYGLSSSDRAVVSAPPPLPSATTTVAPNTASGLNTPSSGVSSLPSLETPAAPQSLMAPLPVGAPAANAQPGATPTAPSSAPVQTNINQPAHLTIRAEKQSWILIADSKGNTVYDHVLKPGDVYKVPDMPGLTLTTGNGGGIILSLDGNDLPKLSGNSRVLHNISLDGDTLKALAGAAGE